MRWRVRPDCVLGLLACCCGGRRQCFAADEDLDANRRELAGLQQQIDETLRDLRGKRAAAGSLSADLDRLEHSLERIRELSRRSDRELTGTRWTAA